MYYPQAKTWEWQQVDRSDLQTQTDFKTVTDRLRAFALEDVAERLGLERDLHDKHKWRDASHIISITEGQFQDWAADQGGGGAIDLVMHVQDVVDGKLLSEQATIAMQRDLAQCDRSPALAQEQSQ